MRKLILTFTQLLQPETTGLSVQWKVDLTRLEWTIKHVAPACLHCCTAASADAMLNAALSVSDVAGEAGDKKNENQQQIDEEMAANLPSRTFPHDSSAALQGVSRHVLAANGHAPHKAELTQGALNLAHSIKILAGNLPCRVVSRSAPLLPGGSS